MIFLCIQNNNYILPKAKPPLTNYQTFFNSGPLTRLDDVSQSLCEGSITEAEYLSAIKAFQRNKTPGTDGLTAEFYL